MKIFENIHEWQKVYSSLASNRNQSPLVMAMGNFDGVHLGHQEILKDAVNKAKKLGGKCLCFTFRPHPMKILYPKRAPQMIQTFTQKKQTIATLGVEILWVQKFDLPFSKINYNEFFKTYVLDLIHPQALRVGHNFFFGHDRKGNTRNLGKLCQEHSIDFFSIPEVRLPLNGEEMAISSSRIRQLLRDGKLDLANRMLGKGYSVLGQVVSGAGRGQDLGFATANISIENDSLLRRGVYVCRVSKTGQELQWPAVANLGIRPTFLNQKNGSQGCEKEEAKEVLEVHLLDFSENLLGADLTVRFLAFLRDEKRFSSPQLLRQQIAKDIKTAREILKKHPIQVR